MEGNSAILAVALGFSVAANVVLFYKKVIRDIVLWKRRQEKRQ